MKKKLLVLGAMVCLIAILAAGTLAYFTTYAVAHNVITSGEIDISIVEVGPDGKTPLEGGGFSVSGVMPNTSVKKEVSVKNEALQPAWVRVKLDCAIARKDGQTGDSKLIDYVYPENSDWVKHSDGYYYYKKPLAAGQTSSVLIKEVAFAPEMDNPYQECTVTVTVKAYAVQTANNTPASGNVLEVKGWPADLT